MNRLVTKLTPEEGYELSIDEIEPPVHNQSGESMRARTQVVSASSKKLTRIEGEFGGCRSFVDELESWFSVCTIDLDAIVQETPSITSSHVRQQLAYVLGDLKTPKDFKQLQIQVQSRIQELFDLKGEKIAKEYATSDDKCALTLSFMMLLSRTNITSPEVISAVFTKIASLRWRDTSDISLYAQILRIALWRTLGDPRGEKPYDAHCYVANDTVIRRKIFNQKALDQFEKESSMMKNESASGQVDPERPASLEHRLYITLLPRMKSFIRAITYYLAEHISIIDMGIHAAVVSLAWLLEWFGRAHILAGEYFAALLFDSQMHVIAHEFFSRHGNLLEELSHPGTGGFWLKLWQLAGEPRDYGLPTQKKSKIVSDPAQGLSLEGFNHFRLETYISLAILEKDCVLSTTERIIMAAELPTEPIKCLLATYNRQLWSIVLSLVRAEAPYNTKRWRYLNMELISAIYLHCPPSPFDNWLNDDDLSSEIRIAQTHEEDLRALLEFYNMRCIRGTEDC